MRKTAELSRSARTELTKLVVGLAINGAAGALAVRQALNAVGEQNIDPELARKLIAGFKEVNDLEKVKVKYLGKSDPHFGPHFDPGANSPNGVVRGPSAKTSRDAIKNKGPVQTRLSLDSPEIALHELGHAKSHAENSWTSKFYGLGAIGAGLGSMLLSAFGYQTAAAAVAAIGSIPVLMEERKASKYAEEYLRKMLPKDEADKAVGVLNRAFSTYALSAGAAVATPIAFGFLERINNGRRPSR